jgi:hypothetical protein
MARRTPPSQPSVGQRDAADPRPVRRSSRLREQLRGEGPRGLDLDRLEVAQRIGSSREEGDLVAHAWPFAWRRPARHEPLPKARVRHRRVRLVHQLARVEGRDGDGDLQHLAGAWLEQQDLRRAVRHDPQISRELAAQPVDAEALDVARQLGECSDREGRKARALSREAAGRCHPEHARAQCTPRLAARRPLRRSDPGLRLRASKRETPRAR